jgi:hypothetical protein
VAAPLSAAAPAAGSGAAGTQVFFLQGEQLVPVSRPGSTLRRRSRVHADLRDRYGGGQAWRCASREWPAES